LFERGGKSLAQDAVARASGVIAETAADSARKVGPLADSAGHAGGAAEGVAWSAARPWMLASVGRAPLLMGSDDEDEGSGQSGGRGGGMEVPVLQLWEPLALRQ
jgi:hypothetical protein